MTAYRVEKPDPHGFCCYVETRGGIVTRSAPMLRIFRGQPMDNLRRWVQHKGGSIEVLEQRPLPDEPS